LGLILYAHISGDKSAMLGLADLKEKTHEIERNGLYFYSCK
jgi:hypothetical protein